MLITTGEIDHLLIFVYSSSIRTTTSGHIVLKSVPSDYSRDKFSHFLGCRCILELIEMSIRIAHLALLSPPTPLAIIIRVEIRWVFPDELNVRHPDVNVVIAQHIFLISSLPYSIALEGWYSWP